jgi:hypothetical protein
MKKRILCVLLAGVMVALAGCSTGVPQEDYDALTAELKDLKEQLEEMEKANENIPAASLPSVQPSEEPSTEPPAEPSEDPVDEPPLFSAPSPDPNAEETEDFEAVFYAYESTYGTQWAFLAVTNNTDQTVEVEGSLKVYNDAGDIVGAKTETENAVGAGQTTLLTYMLDEAFVSSEYEIFLYPDEYNEPVTQNLSYESANASEKEIVTVTNNGIIPAEFVEAHVLFFNGETLVSHDSSFFSDSDYELKPGRSITEEVDCYETYDSIIVFLTGRG